MLGKFIVFSAVIVIGSALLFLFPWHKLPVYQEITAAEVEIRIDRDIFGMEAVVRKEAELAIAAAKEDVERLKTLMVNSMVNGELLEEKIARLQADEATAQQELALLAELIEAGEPVTTANGQVWSVGDLQDRARTRIAQFQTREEQVSIYESSVALHRKAAQEAQSAFRAGENNIAKMESSLSKLEASFDLLNTYQNLSVIDTVGGKPVGQAVADAEKLIAELSHTVAGEIRRQELHRELQAPPVPDLFTSEADSDAALVDLLHELAGTAR